MGGLLFRIEYLLLFCIICLFVIWIKNGFEYIFGLDERKRGKSVFMGKMKISLRTEKESQKMTIRRKNQSGWVVEFILIMNITPPYYVSYESINILVLETDGSGPASLLLSVDNSKPERRYIRVVGMRCNMIPWLICYRYLINPTLSSLKYCREHKESLTKVKAVLCFTDDISCCSPLTGKESSVLSILL